MTTSSTPGDATPTDMLVGRIVRPTNRHYATGIHDDATAQAAGFRGGTIAGSAHLDTLVPLALDQFGTDWFRSGSVSFTFTYATTDGEPTVASMARVGVDGQHQARIETPEGVLVGRGTVGGPDATGTTELFLRELRHDPSNLRILKLVSAGDPIGPEVDRVDGIELDQRVAHGLVTEPIDGYTLAAVAPDSPWSGQIVPPSAVIEIVNRVVSAQIAAALPKAVGMWSALEVRFIDGPVYADVPYRVEGQVVALGESPKTEIIWQDFVLYDASESADHTNPRQVASARVQSRFVKSTSDLWAD